MDKVLSAQIAARNRIVISGYKSRLMDNPDLTWFLDFSEKGQMWHIDLESVSENDSWVNIGYGRYEVLSYFCDMVDVLTSEFKMHLTPEQVLRLAECTPGLTVYQNTDVPEGEFDSDVHMRPIYARETLEKHLAWKEVEE